MKKLNEFFFGIEKVRLSDALWFYGIQAAIITMVAAVFIKTM